VSFSVRLATEADATGIRELFGRTFGRAMSAEEWRWKYPENPDGWHATVAELDGRIVGHYGGWPLRARVGGDETTIVSVGDVATEPSVRHLGGRRNAFRLMADALFETLRSRGVPFVFGFPNERALAAGARLLGYRAEFPVRTVEYEVGPGGSRGAASEWAGASYDALWERTQASLPAGLLRDRRRINWRYHARPERWYRFVTVEDGGREAACGVLSVMGEEALVVEAAVPDESAARALFDALSAEAAALGARRLVFWETPGGPLAAISGRGAARRLPGGREGETGFSFATVPFDAEIMHEFVRSAQITAGIYDDR
jgi:predicted N-acetyltransferase YhbS